MANYKDIHGTNIETVTSDPDNPVNGQVWYNSTDQVLKGFTSNPAGSWATGGNLNTARGHLAGFGASNTAALAAGGGTSGPATSGTVNTELYNGSAWTEVNNLGTARHFFGGGGIYTSGIAAGGYTTGQVALSESWNGTSWTETSDLNNARSTAGFGAVSNTAAVAFGGNPSGSPTNSAYTENWNGSGWTEVSDLNTEGNGVTGIGSQTAALCVGGANRGAQTEQWNGSSWTEVNDMNTAAQSMASGGTTSDGFVSGGYSTTADVKTESWNGSSWTEIVDMSTGRYALKGSGTGGTNALAFGGVLLNESKSNTTESLDVPATSTRTFTVS